MQAVRKLDLTIREGEFFSLLGPSGCGKTTTLRMVAGFEEPTRGEILLDGKDVTDVPPNRRDVNIVFQSYALFPHMSVDENVAFGLRAQGAQGGDRHTGGRDAGAGRADRPRAPPSERAVGRPAAARRAGPGAGQPAAALLLDEPLGALDLKLRQAMQIELKRIQREVGITFVYVTHDQEEALTMSDRIVVMNEARVEQLGCPRDLRAAATRFVAGFIGTSNILTGRVRRLADGVRRARAGAEEWLWCRRPLRDPRAGEAVELTVRPEKITLEQRARPPDGCALTGTVAEIVYLGTSTSYTVQTRRGESMVVFQQNAASPESAADRGDEVWLCWGPEHSYAIG